MFDAQSPSTQQERSSGDNTDDFIASALKNLTLQEREKIYDDIHGVADVIAEEPEFVEKCIRAIREELDRLRANHRHLALHLAESISPAFVNNSKFLLRFLRAERFKPKQAAKRLAAFLELKLELFGAERLCEFLTLSDFDDDEIKALQKGFIQKFPERDRSGRAVFIFFLCKLDIEPGKSLVRIELHSHPFDLKLTLSLSTHLTVPPIILCHFNLPT